MSLYKVKSSRYSRLDHAPSVEEAKQQIVDTGIVMGQKASNLEERAYRSMKKVSRVVGIEFQPSFMAGKNMPGEYRLDFLVHIAGLMYPIQIDGEWVHMTSGAQEEARIKDMNFDNHMIGSGALPVRRVNELEIFTQEKSDRLFQDILR
jgi:hypothetical protein